MAKLPKKPAAKAPKPPRKRARKPSAGVDAALAALGAPQTVLDRARATVERAMTLLDDCVARVAEQLEDPKKKYDPRLASHLAYLSKHAVGALAELRKLEAHELRAVKAMTEEQKDQEVLGYLRAMPRDRRAAARVLLDELDREQLLA